MKKHHRKKYPRHCCSRCNIMHRTYAGAQAHKAALGGHMRASTKSAHRRRHKTGFAAMSATKRRKIARKGGRASARARGYR